MSLMKQSYLDGLDEGFPVPLSLVVVQWDVVVEDGVLAYGGLVVVANGGMLWWICSPWLECEGHRC